MSTPTEEGTSSPPPAPGDDSIEDSSTISATYKDLFPPIPQATFDQLREADADHVAKYDKIVIAGMNAFFANEFSQAETLFKDAYKEDPLVANAWGTLGTIRAMLSFESEDIEFASSQLLYSAAYGNGVQPNAGVMKSLSNWWNKKTVRLTPYQFRALVVVGESELLRANVLLLQDTMSGYLKAGLALRRGYNVFDRLLKYLAAFPDDHGVDANSVGGVHFGVGAIHVVTSILPPKILGVLKALGYMHDRDVGMNHLHQCLHGRTLRSPIASLLLLAFHGVLPSFAPLTLARNIPLAEKVIAETLAVYPKSIIHLWLSGRVERLKKNTDGAVAIFKNCVNYGATLRQALPQLEHFALYDLAWSYTSKRDWLSAYDCFRRLELESAWSKMFYAYAQSACLDMVCVDAAIKDDDARSVIVAPTEAPELNAELSDTAAKVPLGTSPTECEARRSMLMEELSPATRVQVLRILARQGYQRSLGCLSFKVGGKTISIEQFAKRRLKHKYGFKRSPKQAELYEKGTGGLSTEEIVAATNGADALLIPDEAIAQDMYPLRLVTGLELAGHFNVFVQTEPEDLEALTSYCNFFDSVALDRASGEDAAVVSLLRANINRAAGGSQCEEIYQELIDAPPMETEKWVQPYALYNKGVRQYEAGDHAASRETLTQTMKKKHGGKDYNFEMQMAFRLHLTQDMFTRDDAAAKQASAAAAKGTGNAPF